MRVVNKFKGYNNLRNLFEKFPLRVQRFKTTKWKNLKSLLHSHIKKKVRIKFEDTSTIKLNSRTWDKNKNNYKEKLSLMRTFSMSMDKRVTKLNLNYSLTKGTWLRNILTDSLLRFEFRLDIFLWKLGVFKSPFQAYQSIAEKNVYVNGKSSKSNSFLNLGDIVFVVKHKNSCFFKTGNNEIIANTFQSFIEKDNYSNRFVIVKKLSELSNEDFTILLKGTQSLKKLKDSI